MRNNAGNNIVSIPNKYMPDVSSDILYFPSDEATLNTYLNTTYYNYLNNDSKELIQSHLFNVGILENDNSQSLQGAITQEKEYTWKGNIGLMSATDYVRASTDVNCINVNSAVSGNCKENNYLYIDGSKRAWTLSVSEYGQYGGGFSSLWIISNDGTLYHSPLYTRAISNNYVYPTVYIKADIIIKGEGTIDNPYVLSLIENNIG